MVRRHPQGGNRALETDVRGWELTLYIWPRLSHRKGRGQALTVEYAAHTAKGSERTPPRKWCSRHVHAGRNVPPMVAPNPGKLLPILSARGRALKNLGGERFLRPNKPLKNPQKQGSFCGPPLYRIQAHDIERPRWSVFCTLDQGKSAYRIQAT